MVGIGAILAAVGGPMVVESGRNMIISQGMRWRTFAKDTGDTSPSDASNADGGGTSEGGTGLRRSETVRESMSSRDGDDPGPNWGRSGKRRFSLDSNRKLNGLKLLARIPTGSPSLEDLSRGSAFSFTRYVAKTTDPSILSNPSALASTSSLDRRKSQDSDSPPPTIDLRSQQRHLLSSHYFHSELQFVMTLIDISDRLRTVPKEARQSTLVAELTLLNHNLPADVCIPLWCPASPQSPFHHRVVRISPGDAVVLNSADRVPYLITVEVVENENVSEGMIRNQSTEALNHIDEGEDGETRGEQTLANGRGSHDRDGGEKREGQESSSAQYHKFVLDRRTSIASIATSPGVTGDPFSDPGHAQTPTAGHTLVDEFSERMRTAAVMLAQLYQQQQRDLSTNAALTPPPIANVQSAATSVPSSPPHPPASRSTLPVPSSGYGSAPSSAPGSPSASSTKDRRKAQKLRSDFEQIRNRLVKEMMMLEEKRVEALAARLKEQAKSRAFVEGATDEVLPEEDEKTLRATDKEDPSAAVFRETWEAKKARIRASSPFGTHPRWRLLSVIVKSGADLRQEQLALQLIKEMQRIWKEANVPSGLVETIRNAISVHSIKKEGYAKKWNQQGLAFTLYDYFVKEFGEPGGERFRRAQDRFMRSLAGYSLICYILQIKDRHNGNILLDNQGHLIHIDFGFMLSNSPGSVGFELAPFKMPQEYIDILGGVDSEKFFEFRMLLRSAFSALRKKADHIVGLVEMMEKDLWRC
ncbi:Phosphatidylinositol 4-kinase pik1alpha (PI4-kinase)(PtdIns-4-kinase) [Borealophlyctis nickersoniae]|nr:Phosphatidylinositol 4-kinase pik1alpha (PI4-kinase)(PtdIns-4-kinase) [Borealophlyctis nickersoniae]